MITAKDIFFLEREMIEELERLSRILPHDEADELFEQLNGISEAEYNQMKWELEQRQTSPLNRIKNGETLSQKEISVAVMQACKE